MRRALLAGLLLVATDARADDEVQPYADAVLTPEEAYVDGSFGAHQDARAVWSNLGEIRPFDGSLFAAFGTGDLETPAIPGTDLGLVGLPGDGGVHLQLFLDPPAWARSLRFAVTAIAPAFYDPSVAGAVEDDACRVLVQGNGLSLDPWTNGESLRPTSAAFEQPHVGAISGLAWLEGMRATHWIEGIHAISGPVDSLRFEFWVGDGGEVATYDFVCLLDGVRFDRAHPVSRPQPGVIPSIHSVQPTEIPRDRETILLVEGRDLLVDGAVFRPIAPNGTFGPPLEVVADEGPAVASTERVRLRLPPLSDLGMHGIRLEWREDDVLEWADLYDVRTLPPRIFSVVPDVGPPGGGNRVVFTGAGFYDVSSIYFGDRQAVGDAIVVHGPEHLEVLVPGPGEQAGPVDVRITAGGADHVLEDGYTIAAAVEPSPDDSLPPGGPSPGCSQGSPSPSWALLLLPLLRRRGATRAGSGRRAPRGETRSAARRAPGTCART